jgi:hypothetical protein
MNTPTFTKIRNTRTAAEADVLIATLRAAGLHPQDLAMSDHYSVAGMQSSFWIVVPTEEVLRAREILGSHETD